MAVVGAGDLFERGECAFQTKKETRLEQNARRDFRTIVKKSGILHCTLHDLRRTCFSHLASAGINEAVVQKLAGHSSISTTLKHYTRILPESLRQAPLRLAYANSPAIIPLSYPEAQSAKEAK